jgi:hypothetical protein
VVTMISHDETLDWSARWQPEWPLLRAATLLVNRRGPIYCISQLTPGSAEVSRASENLANAIDVRNSQVAARYDLPCGDLSKEWTQPVIDCGTLHMPPYWAAAANLPSFRVRERELRKCKSQ